MQTNKCQVQERTVTNVTFSALSSGRKRPFVKHLNVTYSDKNSTCYELSRFMEIQGQCYELQWTGDHESVSWNFTGSEFTLETAMINHESVSDSRATEVSLIAG